MTKKRSLASKKIEEGEQALKDLEANFLKRQEEIVTAHGELLAMLSKKKSYLEEKAITEFNLKKTELISIRNNVENDLGLLDKTIESLSKMKLEKNEFEALSSSDTNKEHSKSMKKLVEQAIRANTGAKISSLRLLDPINVYLELLKISSDGRDPVKPSSLSNIEIELEVTSRLDSPKRGLGSQLKLLSSKFNSPFKEARKVLKDYTATQDLRTNKAILSNITSPKNLSPKGMHSNSKPATKKQDINMSFNPSLKSKGLKSATHSRNNSIKKSVATNLDEKKSKMEKLIEKCTTLRNKHSANTTGFLYEQDLSSRFESEPLGIYSRHHTENIQDANCSSVLLLRRDMENHQLVKYSEFTKQVDAKFPSSGMAVYFWKESMFLLLTDTISVYDMEDQQSYCLYSKEDTASILANRKSYEGLVFEGTVDSFRPIVYIRRIQPRKICSGMFRHLIEQTRMAQHRQSEVRVREIRTICCSTPNLCSGKETRQIRGGALFDPNETVDEHLVAPEQRERHAPIRPEERCGSSVSPRSHQPVSACSPATL